VISIWQAPVWLYADPDGGGRWREKRRVPREKWDELAESITSYLVYAKQQYGVEPDLFSFNESNIGINVLLTPEEHRDLIKLLGPRMEKLGLKTRMLLADATGARGTHEFALAAANDPEAMRYVTAVAFHSWGGATPEQYAAWGDLAEWLGLPLLVTELGVDAAAHRGRTYDSFHYGIREVEMYQQLLLHARPRATMHWEFTPDYNLLGADGQPTHRFWFVKQFADLTPRGAEALGTASSHARVLFTAFAKADAYTLHVANLGAAREITIEGIPAAVKMLRAVRTSENERYQALPPLVPQGGALRFPMPARALLTLTTVIE
jgi:O-glycosyl hydrolase